MNSKQTLYHWRCETCNQAQSFPVWRILYAEERPDVVDRLLPGLAYLRCPNCNAFAEIDQAVAVVRPGNALPILLGLSRSDLDRRTTNGQDDQLLRELSADADRRRDGTRVFGPPIVLPRILIMTVLTRDPIADLQNVGQSSRDASDDPWVQENYRRFLEIVAETQPIREVTRALAELWGIFPDDFESFVRRNPQLASSLAVDAIDFELEAGPPPGESDAPLLARQRLINDLATGVDLNELKERYYGAVGSFGERIQQRLISLLDEIAQDPTSASDSTIREALHITLNVHDEFNEARLAALLAQHLLESRQPDSVEEAIQLLDRSLYLTEDDDPEWRVRAANLAMAYSGRILGDRTENWQAAFELMQKVDAAADRDADPKQWATIKNNFGFLLLNRPSLAEPDLAEALAMLSQSLEERSPEVDVVDWAYSKLIVGLLYQRRTEVGDSELARRGYAEALEFLRREDDPTLWITINNNLATLYVEAEPYDPGAAEELVTNALAVVHPSDKETQARLLWLMGRAKALLLGQSAPATTESWTAALQSLDPALAPELVLNIGSDLTGAVEKIDDWETAASAYRSMLTAHRTLYDAQITTDGRAWALARDPRLARRAAFALAKAGDSRAAVEALEEGRARQLSVSARRESADLKRLYIADATLAQRYVDSLEIYRSTIGRRARSETLPSNDDEVKAAEAAVRQITEDIRRVPGFEQFLRPMTVEDISAAARERPVVYILNSPQGSFVLSVRVEEPGSVVADSFAVPEISSAHVASLVSGNPQSDEDALLSAQMAPQILRRQKLYNALQRTHILQPLLSPVANVLSKANDRSIVLIATGVLGYIPLAAVPCDDAGRGLDDFGQTYQSPSAALFRATEGRAMQHSQASLIGVADTDHANRLPGSMVELAEIARIFPTGAKIAHYPDATLDWVLTNAPSATYLHLACHGRNEFESPNGGYIRLSGPENLTLERLADGSIGNCRLAIASACQSGQFALGHFPDEFLGLPSGLLLAGAACVIVSLWQVDDVATALLMIKLYELLGPQLGTHAANPAGALQSARAWLRTATVANIDDFINLRPNLSADLEAHGLRQTWKRDLAVDDRPYSDPQYWAAFVSYGA